ncbi:hypothetical protein [Paenibacillus sp. FSL L8-0709]|uniref:hypothetical protein n=1 Tax=Paenibacillus sp. FSL L8-0709 TaxID=2975312 RepID=UPI0030FA0C97
MKKSTVFNLILIVSLILNVVVLINSSNINSKVNDQSAVSASLKANSKFLESFFTYQTTKEKYEVIKPLMTDVGYRSTFPSGMEIPEDSAEYSVSSKMTSLKPFQFKENDMELEFLNELTVTTTFNQIETTETVVVKTVLVNKQDKWLVNDIIMIGEIAGEE